MLIASILKAEIYLDSTGVSLSLPVLIIEGGIIHSILQYSIYHAKTRSLRWHRNRLFMITLLLEYISVNQRSDPVDMFSQFALRLQTGTIDHMTGGDPTGLYWKTKRPKECQSIISGLTEVFDWLAKRHLIPATINPAFEGSLHDRMVKEAAYQYRRNSAILGHTWAANGLQSNDPRAYPRVVATRTPSKTLPSQPPNFPEQHFSRLLTDGFRVGKRYDIRGMLIALLQHGGGLRESEPFHLFIQDVFVDPANTASALVIIHHPQFGAAPDDWTVDGKRAKGTREDYLRDHWGLRPRNCVIGPMHAGFKSRAVESIGQSEFLRVRWFPPEYGVLFQRLWLVYIAQIVDIERNHPYAFVNIARDPIGEPYKLGKYRDAHAAAVKRIGLKVGQSLGTQPHGHRHAYGARLSRAKVSEKVIMKCMHHSSVESQRIYTQPTEEETMAELASAVGRLNEAVGIIDAVAPQLLTGGS